MEQVLIKTDPQEWRRFLASLQLAQATIRKLKRTSAQAKMLRAVLKEFPTLKSTIEENFVEWETLQQQEIPPLEAKIDAMQEQVDQMIHSIKQIQQK